MAKAPAFQFYTGDWLKDPALSMCSPATRGIWVDLLCAIHELHRAGQITGTRDQLSRTCRCSTVELVDALQELEATNAARVTDRNGKVTVTCRRLQREFEARKSNADRQKRYRQKRAGPYNGGRNAKITPYSSSSTSVTTQHTQQGRDSSASRFTLEDVENVAAIVGLTGEEARVFFDHYNRQGWVFGNGNVVVDLQSAMHSWKKNEFKFQERKRNGQSGKAKRGGTAEAGKSEGTASSQRLQKYRRNIDYEALCPPEKRINVD